MIIVKCDRCKEEIKGENVGQKGHDVEWNGTMIHVVLNPPCDLCLDCLLELITKKPKRKYERKQKEAAKELFEAQVASSPVLTEIMKKVKPVANEELIIQVATEEAPNYGVNILGRLGVAPTLKEAVLDAIAHEPAWEGKIPHSLSKKNKDVLEGILA